VVANINVPQHRDVAARRTDIQQADLRGPEIALPEETNTLSSFAAVVMMDASTPVVPALTALLASIVMLTPVAPTTAEPAPLVCANTPLPSAKIGALASATLTVPVLLVLLINARMPSRPT